MTATDRADAFEVGVAQVNFWVRCETLGHGDEVFLVSDEGQGAARKVSQVGGIASDKYELFSSVKVFSLRWRERHELFEKPPF